MFRATSRPARGDASQEGQHARFFPRACIAHQRFLPIMYRSNGMPPIWGAHGGGFELFSAPSFSQSQCRPRAGMRHRKASMPVFSARMHYPSKISADKCTGRTECLQHRARGGGFGQSPLPHARGHSAARARGCVMERPARPVTASWVCARFPAAATACRARWPHPRFVTRYIAPGHVSPAAFMSVPDISLRQIPMLLQIGIKIQIRRVGSLFIHLTFVPALERHAY